MTDLLEHSAAPTPTPPHRKGVRTRALLAGGLVLGLGAAVTLAAWNDSEFAQGTFTAGSFGLEGSVDGTTFTDNPETAPAALGFTVDASTLQPGDVVTAPFAVRLTAASVEDAIVTVLPATIDGVATGLTYSLVQNSVADCAAGVVLAPLVPAGTALGAPLTDVTFALAQGAAGDPGAPVYLCFAVTAGVELVQAQTGTATWEFNAESQAS